MGSETAGDDCWSKYTSRIGSCASQFELKNNDPNLHSFRPKIINSRLSTNRQAFYSLWITSWMSSEHTIVFFHTNAFHQIKLTAQKWPTVTDSPIAKGPDPLNPFLRESQVENTTSTSRNVIRASTRNPENSVTTTDGAQRAPFSSELR